MHNDRERFRAAATPLVLVWGLLVGLGMLGVPAFADEPEVSALPVADGYRGIWYANQPSSDAYKYKYSGGMATYPQQHRPIAWHAPEVGKTFFCYGGVGEDGSLLHMISFYDHETGTVPRPRILLDKETTDAHDNPVLALDAQGYIWIFSNAHGRSRPSYIHRSREPYRVDAFERVLETNFSYGQPHVVPDAGLFLLHTRYLGGRFLHTMTSPDGRDWSEPKLIARAEQGHYQISTSSGSRVGTAFNVHPNPIGLNARTNLYYLETDDLGATWTNAAGTRVLTPINKIDNPALVVDERSQDRLVYLKNIVFDEQDNPVILYLTSKGYRSGPSSGPRLWKTARWTGLRWEIQELTTSDHNYDFGFLNVDEAGTWRVLATTDPGPQAFGTGGDLVLWVSRNRGASWRRERTVTRASMRNPNYPRQPVNAHPDFFALWADGDAFQPSPSRLFFCNRDGREVYRLPTQIDGDSARPMRVDFDR